MKRTLDSTSVRELIPLNAKPEVKTGADLKPTQERDASEQSEKSGKPEKSPKKIRIKSEKRSAVRKSVTLISTAQGLQPSQASAKDAQAEPVSPRRSMKDASSSLSATSPTPAAECSQPQLKSPTPASPPASQDAWSQQELALSPERKQSGAERREQWLSQDKPSFIFDEITDPGILALISDSTFAAHAPEPPATQAPVADQVAEKARKQALSSLAREMQRAIEGPLANIIRQFMLTRTQQQEHAEYEVAHKAFYEMLSVLNLAKVAATNANEADMVADLEKTHEQLGTWISVHWKHASRHFKAEKSATADMKKALLALLTDCDRWRGRSGSDAPKDHTPPVSPDGRQRSNSSPVKPAATWGNVETKPSRQALLRHADATSPKSSHHRLKASGGEASPSASPTTSPIASPVSSPRASGKPSRPASVIGIMPVSPPREPESAKSGPKGLSSPVQPRSSLASLTKPPLQGDAQVLPRKKQ